MTKRLDILSENIRGQSTYEKQHLVQMATLESIEELNGKILKLNKTIIRSNEQGSKVEKSNQRLQGAMFMLTLITTAVAIYQFSDNVLKTLGVSGQYLITWSSLITAVLTLIISLAISKSIRKW